MGPTFSIVCPWFTVNSKKALDKLFDLYFESEFIPSPLLEVFLRNMKYLEVNILAFDDIEFNTT
jgi:hypothetical protein